MEFKGTKGNWEVNNNEYGYYTSVSTNNSQNPNPFRTICVSRVNDQEQSNANLKLIAAAPEMFEMLRKLIVTFSRKDLELYQVKRLEEAEQLLKKITE